MSRFHALTVKDVRKETHDAVSIAFDIPDDLLDAFRFTQGQYLTAAHIQSAPASTNTS